jgi:hypothetical protein
VIVYFLLGLEPAAGSFFFALLVVLASTGCMVLFAQVGPRPRVSGLPPPMMAPGAPALLSQLARAVGHIRSLQPSTCYM